MIGIGYWTLFKFMEMPLESKFPEALIVLVLQETQMMRNNVIWIALALLISTRIHAVSYQDLDQNQDGYLNNDEAQNMPELAGQWNVTDANQDGKVDKAEFALFEITINESLDVDNTR